MASDGNGSGDKPNPQQDGEPLPKSSAIEFEKKIDAAVHREENENQAAITNKALVDRIDRSDRWMIGLTAVIAVGGLVSAVIFGMQLRAMRSTDEKIGQQLILMQGQLDQMHVDQRAWVSFEPDIKLTKGIEYDANGMHWTINFPVHNTGHSPAAYVWVDPPLVTKGFGSKDETLKRVAFINEEKHIPPVFDSGRYLFPGDRGDFVYTVGIGKEELAQIQQSAIKALKPAITTCVRYYFMTETIPHLTCVTTEMFTKRGLISADNTAPIAIEDIVFRYFMWGPSFTN